MNVWEIAILKSIKSLGGEAGLQQIYKELLIFKEFLKITKKHLRTTYGRSAYQHEVRSNVANLMQAGELEQIISGWGEPYSLTEKGIKRIDIEEEKRP